MASPRLKSDKDFAIEVCSIYGKNIKFLSPELRSDREVAFAAINNDGLALSYIAPELQRDKKILSYALSQNGLALKDVPPDLRNNKHLVMTAVTNNGYALEFAGPDMKKDKDIIRMACQQSSKNVEYAIQSGYSEALYPILQMVKLPLVYADHSLLKEKEFALEMVRSCGIHIKYLPPELQNDNEIAATAINQNSWSIAFAGENIKKDPTLINIAIQDNSDLMKYSYIGEKLPVESPGVYEKISLDNVISRAENKVRNSSVKKGKPKDLTQYL